MAGDIPTRMAELSADLLEPALDAVTDSEVIRSIPVLGVGLLGHLLAAHAIGGSPVAYRHHILGFVGLSLVSGALIAGLGWRFWRGRHDITLLILGALQALLGLLVYLERFGIGNRVIA